MESSISNRAGRTRKETIMPYGIEFRDIAGVGVQTIIRSVLEYFGLTIEEAKSRDRHLPAVMPRHYLHYFLTVTNMNYKMIGYVMGFDHTAVIHSRKVIQNLISVDKRYRAQAYALAQLIISNNKKQTDYAKEN